MLLGQVMLSKFVCWGFGGPLYSGKRYEVSLMLFDSHPGQNWYCEPYVRSSFISDGVIVEVKGNPPLNNPYLIKPGLNVVYKSI